MLRSPKHQVFKQMGKPGFIRRFIPGTHLIQQIGGSEGCIMVLVNDDGQPVVQDVFFKVYQCCGGCMSRKFRENQLAVLTANCYL